MARLRSQDGLTLIEIMVVILILGLLATLVVQNVRGAVDRGKKTKARADITTLKEALESYYIDNGFYPSTDQGVNALVNQPTSGRAPADYRGGGYIQSIPKDPWGNPYVYQSDGSSYVLKSYGPDGVQSSDDITSE